MESTVECIRKYRSSDLEILKQITMICFEEVSIDKNIQDRVGVIAGLDWKQRKAFHIDEDVAQDAQGVFVAESQQEIAGYITTKTNDQTRIGDIPNLAVLPRFRRQGIARRLVLVALEHLKIKGMLYTRIATLDQNAIGANFYPQEGFVEVARQIHYLRPL